MFKLFGKVFRHPASEPPVFHPADTCAHCGSRLLKAEGPSDAWVCPNPDCPPQLRARLEHWCSAAAMDIPGGDTALVEKLVARGLAYDPAELYRIKLRELAALPGMDQTSAQGFIDALAASLKRDAWRVLFGLAIPNVGAEEALMLCKKFQSLDDLFAAGREGVQKISGRNENVARSVAHWYDDSVNRKLVRRLAKAGVNFKSASYEIQP